MRKICLVSLSATYVLLAADARENAVLAAEKTFWTCWNAHDTGCFEKLLTPDFVEVTRGATVVDKSGILTALKAGRYSQADLNAKVENRKVRFYGQTAILTCTRRSDFEPEKAVVHQFTQVWVNQGGKWSLATMHTSVPPNTLNSQ